MEQCPVAVRRNADTCRAGRRGAALVVVLAFLVLITVLTVAFFVSTSGEAGASKTEAESLTVRQLSDSTIHYVLSRIRSATSGGTTTAWASQPGAIRTFGSDGQPRSAFKLYSALRMEEAVGAGGWDAAGDQPPADWRDARAHWTDLNAPVEGAHGTIFPIIDPRAAGKPPGKSDPMVDGFAFDASAMPGAVFPGSSEDAAARAPMPVRWIYVLKDGRFATPRGGTGPVADFSASDPRPSADNPIVGRVAFWTDDETSKLNLNTACGGNYWDVPMLGSVQDLYFARHQPSKNEFNRYPGHPATTSLVPVLWSLGDSPLGSPYDSLMPVLSGVPASGNVSLFPGAASGPFWMIPSVSIQPAFSTRVEKFLDGIFQLSPRNSWRDPQGNLAGSAMGLKPTVQDTVTGKSLNPLSSVDDDRLYATVDEAFFLDPGTNPPPRTAWSGNLTEDQLERIRFFLTTHSRAPETNLFNQPKITIWPLDDETRSNPVNQFSNAADSRSAADRLIAFCSTLNGFPYYFTRNDPSSATADWTARNGRVYDYLVRLMEEPIPGFGASFSSRFGNEGCERLATLTYDYIRSAVNLADTTSTPAATVGLGRDSFKHYFTKPPLERTVNVRYDPQPGTGQVVPIQIGDTKGIGRFPVIQQATLHFIAQAANQPPVQLDPDGRPTTVINPMHPWTDGPPASATLNTSNGTTSISYSGGSAYPTISGQTHAGLPFLTDASDSNGILQVPNPRYQVGPLPSATANATGTFPPHKTQVQAAFYVTLVNVSAGYVLLNSDLKIRVRGLGGFRADGQALFSASLDSAVEVFKSANPAYFLVGQNTINGRSTMGVNELKANFIGLPVIVGQGGFGETFTFSGGPLVVELLSADNEVVQTVSLDFPSSTFPTPILPPLASISGLFGGNRRNLLFSDAVLSANGTVSFPPVQTRDLTPSSMLTFDAASDLAKNPNSGVGSVLYRNNCTRIDQPPSGAHTNRSNSYPHLNLFVAERGDSSGDYRANLTADTIRSVEVAYGDPRIVAVRKDVDSTFYQPHRFYHDSRLRPAHSLRIGGEFARGQLPQYLSVSAPQFQSTWNSSRPLVYEGGVNGNPTIPSGSWNLATSQEIARFPVFQNNAIASGWPFTTSSAEFEDGKFVWTGVPKFSEVWADGGDFGTSLPRHPDAPHIGKAEEGTMKIEPSHPFPYFHIQSEVATSNYTGETLFSPNRQVPSPVVFGSLPIGSTPEEAWRTWLFCPNPASPGHVSIGKNPPDYAFLDFFHMPVVEPYAISDPFSTAGKVNMNHRIAPFGYLTRTTALRGLLQSEMVTAVPDSQLPNKNLGPAKNRLHEVPSLSGTSWFNSADVGYSTFRYPIHAAETLKQWDKVLGSGGIFRSASEVCSLWLYPARRPGAADASRTAEVNWTSDNSLIRSWWYDDPGGAAKSLTGDNLRERPYSTLYPRLTTKSNTYTIHHRVQTLQKVTGSSSAVWDESRDRVVAEYRGEALIERYVDPEDPEIPDFAAPENAGLALDGFYRFRILQSKRFAP